MAPRIEVLGSCGKSHRARYFVEQFFGSCKQLGLDVTLNDTYRGYRDWLVLWGVGGDKQLEAWRKHRESGRRVIIGDIGYFHREWDYKQSAFRISVDDWHPQRFVVNEPHDRLERLELSLGSIGDPDGPILVCGMGPKSRKLYAKERWDYEVVQRLRTLYPHKTILYRPKPRHEHERIEGSHPAVGGGITDWLRGTAFAVVHHSNIAVDCAVHGVPCVAFDGIGATLYGKDLAAPYSPTEAERQQFLANVAYWNWRPFEMTRCVKWLINRFGNDSQAGQSI